jgi:hypothetical protein
MRTSSSQRRRAFQSEDGGGLNSQAILWRAFACLIRAGETAGPRCPRTRPGRALLLSFGVLDLHTVRLAQLQPFSDVLAHLRRIPGQVFLKALPVANDLPLRLNRFGPILFVDEQREAVTINFASALIDELLQSISVNAFRKERATPTLGVSWTAWDIFARLNMCCEQRTAMGQRLTRPVYRAARCCLSAPRPMRRHAPPIGPVLGASRPHSSRDCRRQQRPPCGR